MNGPHTEYALPGDVMARYDLAEELRDLVNGELELARTDKLIGKSLEAAVTLYFERPEDLPDTELSDLFIVSALKVEPVVGETTVSVKAAPGEKCPRCWKHTTTPDANGLCPRCAEVVKNLPNLA